MCSGYKKHRSKHRHTHTRTQTAMQRRVSLIVTEQGPDRNSAAGGPNDAFRKQQRSPHPSMRAFEENDKRPSESLQGSSMGHTRSMWCTSDMNNGSQSHQTADEGLHSRRVSLDDLDVASLRPRGGEGSGSVPMIGSLVYYRHKSDSAILNQNTQGDAQGDAQGDEHGAAVPRPATLTTAPPARPCISDDGDGADDEEAVLSDAESVASPIPPHMRHRKYRHFSYPWIYADEADEFGMINSKIDSRIRQNDQRLSSYFQNQRKRSHFNNTHYHIPGLDPAPSPDSELSESSAPAALPSKSRPSSTSMRDSVSPNSTGNRSPHTNSRHRRRLTCAMIFTTPKVVEI